MTDIEKVLKVVCKFLNENNMRYVMVGGIAVMYHGVPRTTVDIKFIVDMNKTEIELFVSFLQSEDFDANFQDLIEALDEHTHCTIFVDESLLRLDIQGEISDFDRATLERAIKVDFFDTIISLSSVEDTLINKILFASEQDIRDASGIFARHKGELDLEYIEKICKPLGILSKWVQFRREMLDMKSRDLRDFL
jgi:hypothetical protein